MKKNRSLMMTYLASMEIGATIGLTRILRIVFVFFFGVNDIFNCALEGP